MLGRDNSSVSIICYRGSGRTFNTVSTVRTTNCRINKRRNRVLMVSFSAAGTNLASALDKGVALSARYGPLRKPHMRRVVRGLRTNRRISGRTCMSRRVFTTSSAIASVGISSTSCRMAAVARSVVSKHTCWLLIWVQDIIRGSRGPKLQAALPLYRRLAHFTRGGSTVENGGRCEGRIREL